MFRSRKATSKPDVPWQHLTSTSQINVLLDASKSHPVLIFKHSTRCGISRTALDRFEREWSSPSSEVTPYYLDLLAHRSVSNAVADQLGVRHESPQAILIRDGKVLYHASHMGISVKEMMAQLGK